VHAPFGFVPAITDAQIPFAVFVIAWAQAWQAPVHDALQQYPCAQNEDVH
jgi:hypothetical protein